MAGKNNKGTRFDKSGCEKSRPVVVAMVSVKDARFCPTEDSGKGKNLRRAKSWKGVKCKSLSFRRKWRVDRAGDFNRPAQLGKPLG